MGHVYLPWGGIDRAVIFLYGVLSKGAFHEYNVERRNKNYIVEHSYLYQSVC